MIIKRYNRQFYRSIDLMNNIISDNYSDKSISDFKLYADLKILDEPTKTLNHILLLNIVYIIRGMPLSQNFVKEKTIEILLNSQININDLGLVIILYSSILEIDSNALKNLKYIFSDIVIIYDYSDPELKKLIEVFLPNLKMYFEESSLLFH